ncbi:MAG: hypothetical protein PHQ43_01245 [Dehalococcoidales bacterium]|nr:hypothetical protein [Dehalococcoidales bacterium]
MATNIKDILTDATKYPARVEEMLPSGAPQISSMLTTITDSLPAVPDFPVEIPDLPEPPAAPTTATAGLKRTYVTSASMVPATTTTMATTTTTRNSSALKSNKSKLYFE